MAKKARAKKGAGKAKGRKTAPKKSAAPAVAHPYKVTPGNILTSLLNGAATTKKKTWEINSEYGKRVAHAVEHNGLNKKALNLVKPFWALKNDPAALRDLRDTFFIYLKDTGLEEIADSAPPFDGMEAGNDPGYEKGEAAEGEQEPEQGEAFPEDDDRQVAAE